MENTPDPMTSEREARGGKRVVEIGRWRVAVMYGSRYRLGAQIKRVGRKRVGLTAGLGVCVVTAIRRSNV